jgi:hypothetical protein
MELTTHPHVEPMLTISIAALLDNFCVSHDLLWDDIYISCSICLIQHSLTVIPVNTNLPLTNNCTQRTVSADIASVCKIHLLSVQNNINQNILYIHNVPIFTNDLYNSMTILKSTYCYTQ